MLHRKVFGIAILTSFTVGSYAYNPFSTSLYLTEAQGNPNVLTMIDSGSPVQVGYDTIKLILKPVQTGASYYFEPFTGLSTMSIQDPITSQKALRDFFCVELERDLFTGASEYKKYDAMGKVGWLVNQINATNKTNATLMAGLQIAVWEVAYDGTNGNSYDLGDGIFRTDGLYDQFADQKAAREAAQNWLSALSQVGGTQAYNYYHSPGDSHNKSDWQDLVSPVPEPTTVAALTIGAACLIRRRRKA